MALKPPMPGDTMVEWADDVTDETNRNGHDLKVLIKANNDLVNRILELEDQLQTILNHIVVS